MVEIVISCFKLKIVSISIKDIFTWSQAFQFFSFLFSFGSFVFVNMFIVDSNEDFVNI